jgi:DNA-directed RNA polymerase specialized sigma24 family protein
VSDTSTWPASHLHAADTAFAALTCQPSPLTMDCDALAAGADLGLPCGAVPLPVLRDWLLAHPDNYPARDAVWRELVLRARLHGKQWTIAAVGMAMPALVRLAGQLTAGYRGDPTDVDNELLTGFLEALRDHLDVTRPALYASLTMAAWRAARELCLAQDVDVPVDDIEYFAVAGPRAPQPLYNHPDLLVARAGALGVLDTDDVAPWIEVRLGRRDPEPIAQRLGVSVDALRMRLARADERLVAALSDGMLSGLVSLDAGKRLRRRTERGDRVRAGRTATGRVPRPAAA